VTLAATSLLQLLQRGHGSGMSVLGRLGRLLGCLDSVGHLDGVAVGRIGLLTALLGGRGGRRRLLGQLLGLAESSSARWRAARAACWRLAA
jgi:hypothetical protein